MLDYGAFALFAHDLTFQAHFGKIELAFDGASAALDGITTCSAAKRSSFDNMLHSSKKTLVYLETSFISYLTAPFSRDEKIAREQLASRRWWEEECPKCDTFVSDLVLQEAARGNAEQSRRRMEFLKTIRSVAETDEAKRLADLLIEAHALPENSSEDAFHVALAAVYGADIVLTWNCRHIANPLTLPKTVAVVMGAGYDCPALATPAQLLEAWDGQSDS